MKLKNTQKFIATLRKVNPERARYMNYLVMRETDLVDVTSMNTEDVEQLDNYVLTKIKGELRR